jgi:hypothetical protein
MTARDAPRLDRLGLDPVIGVEPDQILDPMLRQPVSRASG